MKKIKIKDGAHVFIINEKGDVLLGKHVHHEQKWGFFGGGMEKGEIPYATLKREIKEELGIKIIKMPTIYLEKKEISRERGDNTVYVFKSKISDEIFRKISLSDGEIEKVKFFSKEEILENKGGNILPNTQKIFKEFLKEIYK